MGGELGPQLPHDGPQGTAASPHPTGLPDGFAGAVRARPRWSRCRTGRSRTQRPVAPGRRHRDERQQRGRLRRPRRAGRLHGRGDLRATITAPSAFDRTYDTTLAPGASADQRKAAVTQLFYDINFLHDWFYDAGFDEASGNAQTDNYGRGGARRRPHPRRGAGLRRARNNANMSTPADGAPPRMQMYIFDRRATRR